MAEQTSKKEYVYWADLIRVVAIYLVVVIHVSGQLTNLWGQIPNDQWIIADIYGGIARISVPLFFMISGYLLLPRSESLGTFYSKRMTKILIPFVVWSLIYLAWFCGGHPGTCNPNFVAQLLLVQGTYYHLWFLYSLISIYLILPIMRLMIGPETDKKILWYLIGLWLVFQPILSIANAVWSFKINISPPWAMGFVCFFILGYLLGEMELSRIRMIFSSMVWILGTLVTITGTYIFSIGSSQYTGFFYDFVSLNVILASGAAFILLKWISEGKVFDSPRIRSITRSLSAASFGIYLIHIMVIEILRYGLRFDTFTGNAIWSIPLVTTAVFVLSFLIIRGLQKIPILNQIVP